jgi:hypothetical protein
MKREEITKWRAMVYVEEIGTWKKSPETWAEVSKLPPA